MKKGLCIVLSILMLVLSFAACSKKTTTTDDEETKVDENGTVYVEVTNEDGETVTSVVAEDVNATTNKNSSSTTTESQSQLESNIENAVSGLTNVDEGTFTASEKDLISTGTTISKTTLRDDIILKTVKTGKFTLKMNIKGSDDAETPSTLVWNDDKFACDMTVNSSNVRVIYDDGNIYFVLPSIKTYFKVSSEDVGMDSFFDTMSDIASSDSTYVGSTKVTQDGVEYTCEEYKSDDGTTKYYFSGNEWKRMEGITDDGEVTIMEIQSFTGTADESMFSVKGYSDMSSLLALTDTVTTTTKKK